MLGYIIANYTITDPEKYVEYPPAVGPTIAQYGGKVIVADSNSKGLEGNPAHRTVVIEFESVEAAQRWYDSPEYSKAKTFRIRASEGWVLIVPEFVRPQS